LLGDGVRVVTRWMKKVTAIAGTVGTKLRDRSRSMQRRLMEIGQASRGKGPQAQEKVQTRVRQTAGSHPPGGGRLPHGYYGRTRALAAESTWPA